MCAAPLHGVTMAAQAYDHAYDLAASFAELGMNVEVLVQVRRVR